ncbi:MAG TPA: ROK family protein [Gaiellaceae bacterium]|nr:ROK family protein [Gaiellaceae bacterium]
MAAPLVIGVDVGGTKILAGIADRQGRVLAQHEIPSPTSSEEAVLEALDAVVEELRDDRVEALGYGVPTNLDRASGKIIAGVNLPLTDVDLAGHARERFGLPVGVGNDASVAALAEARLGAGRGSSSIVMLTLGTGVGGGVVLDGRLSRRWAELGHVVVQAGGPPCQGHCHGHGHLEAVASGTAAVRIARELYGPDADAHTLLERAREGDPPAVERIAEMADLLGAAVGSFANVFDPDVFVIGGGFGEAAADLLLERAQEAARREALEPADQTLHIVPAELGSDAGLVGAALVAFEALDGTW